MCKEKTCKNCTCFVQHYARVGTAFGETFYGHCVNPDAVREGTVFVTVKTPVCEFWYEKEQKEFDWEEEFITLFASLIEQTHELEYIFDEKIEKRFGRRVKSEE